MEPINREEIVQLTEQYGGAWGLQHTRRLLNLISLIDEGQEYNADAVWVAAHLHDWGGYSPWKQDGVDHAARSVEVARDFMRERGYPAEFSDLVLECIATHHTCGPNRSIEAVLLSDADGLDFLGVVGVLRDFSKNPRDLRGAYQTVLKRRAKVPAQLCMEKTKQIAEIRLRQMDALLEQFVSDSFDCF